jgi:gliding motility-associated lipoprotein GldD
MKILIKFLPIFILLIGGCGNKSYTPKPHAYPKIDFPQRGFELFAPNCPFELDKPIYSKMILDSGDFSETCWYNMFIPSFDATLHMSYKYFSKPSQLDSMMEDAYKLVFKHTIKAEDIEEIEIKNKNEYKGILYDISGNTATPLNFYITDGKNNFIRGAFYFNNHTSRDSVAPVVTFVREDIISMINSITFK